MSVSIFITFCLICILPAPTRPACYPFTSVSLATASPLPPPLLSPASAAPRLLQDLVLRVALAAARRDTRMCAFSALMHFSTDLHAAGGLPSRVAEPACEIVRLGRKISMERMWTAGGQGEPAAERRSWGCE